VRNSGKTISLTQGGRLPAKMTKMQTAIPILAIFRHITKATANLSDPNGDLKYEK
jgi:hypothetical protein